MSRWTTIGPTTSASCNAGASLQINIAANGSWLNIVKIKVVPSESSGTTTVELYKRDTFQAADRCYITEAFTGNLIDPVKITSGVVTELNEFLVCTYTDLDATNEIHLKITNGGSVAKTYDYTIEYEIAIVGDSAGNVGVGPATPIAKLHVGGVVAGSAAGLLVSGAITAGPYQYGIMSDGTLSGTAQSNFYFLGGGVAAGTAVSDLAAIRIDNPSLGSGASVGTQYMIRLATPTRGSTNYAIYSDGGANYFGGNVGIGTVSPGSKLSVVGLPTSSAGLSAGDIWIDTAAGNVLKIIT